MTIFSPVPFSVVSFPIYFDSHSFFFPFVPFLGHSSYHTFHLIPIYSCSISQPIRFPFVSFPTYYKVYIVPFTRHFIFHSLHIPVILVSRRSISNLFLLRMRTKTFRYFSLEFVLCFYYSKVCVWLILILNVQLKICIQTLYWTS